MKLAYVAWIPVSEESGVLKKVVDQLGRWRAGGHEVSLFALGRGTESWQGAADLDVHLYPAKRAPSWFLQAERLVSDVLRWRPDVVYHRFNVYFPALERLMRRCPTVVELNTLDVPEYRATMSPPRFAYHRATRGRIFRHAQGLVAVTDEIARHAGAARAPRVVIPNGVDLSAIEGVAWTPHERPALLFLGANPADSWHGLDKLFAIAGAMPEIDVHVVGPLTTRTLVPPNVRLHGFLERPRYRPLVAASDVGVGPLALHRKQMQEACPIKIREYLAMGLPAVTAYRDPDFPAAGAPFLLELPNQEDNVASARDQLRAFIERWRGRRVARAEIAHLDSSRKEATRLEFLARVLAAAH